MKASARFGDYASDLKGSDSWEKLVKNFYWCSKNAGQTMRMTSWTKENVEWAVADMGGCQTSMLLRNLEFHVIETAWRLKIKSVKEFFWFLIAYYEIYLNAAEEAANLLAVAALKEFDITFIGSNSFDWISAKNKIHRVLVLKIGMPRDHTCNAIRNPNESDPKKDNALEAVCSALRKIEIDASNVSGWKLSSFFILASIIQNQPVKEVLLDGYNGAVQLPPSANPICFQSKEDVLKRLSRIWADGNPSNNPHINSFKNIAQILAKHVAD
jgi:hypothetical protein